MQNYMPVIVEERTLDFIGVIVIVLVVFILYTMASVYIGHLRYKKLLKARDLILEKRGRENDL